MATSSSIDPIPLSAIVPCFNEEAMIGACLESLKFADEILVVDSFSTDRTLEVARRYTDRVLQHEYVNSAAQKNWVIPQARHPWVLIVDSDERVTPDLASEIKEILRKPEHDGYWIRRRNFFLGREIRHGTWRTDKVLRLFRRDAGRYQSKHVHAEIEMKGSVGWCAHPLIHYSYRDLDDYLRKAPRYTAWGAMNALDKGIHGSRWRMFGHSAACFFKGYIVKRGFADGTEGLIIAMMESFSAFLKYARLWEMQKRQRQTGEKEKVSAPKV